MRVEQNMSDRIEPPLLALCRTPFQARLLREILRPGAVFDLVYVTCHDSPEDRAYYAPLAEQARRTSYLLVDPLRRSLPAALEIRSKTPGWALRERYGTVLLASIDTPALRRLCRVHPEAEIVTFDDGSESILSDPFLMRRGQPWRDRIYGRLVGGGSVRHFRRQIGRHFTIFGDMQNVVEPGRAVPLDLHWSTEKADAGPHATFFIGQPFSEVYSDQQIDRIRRFAAEQRIDFYVKHPRETEPLVPNVPCLDKSGLLAEDAMFLASGDRRPEVIACFSTVLFTLSAKAADKVYLNVPEIPEAALRVSLARSAGCRPVDV